MSLLWRPSPAPYERADLRPRRGACSYTRFILRSRRCKQLVMFLGVFLLALFVFGNFIVGREVQILHNSNRPLYPHRHTSKSSSMLDKLGARFKKVRDKWHSGSAAPPIKNQWNPTVHLLLRGAQRTPSTCRTITSAEIHGYPPPHMLALDGSDQLQDALQTRRRPSAIESINAFLNKEGENSQVELKEDDIVIIVNAADTWFQLPAQLLLQRFLTRLYHDNKRLLDRYGKIDIRYGEQGAFSKRAPIENKRTSVQKYAERILFAASKECHAPAQMSPACIVVPPSPLRPDAYGPKTDKGSKTATKRPRWLTSGMVIGLVSDMRLLYQHAEEVMMRNNWLDEELVLSKIYGEQEYMREYDRQNFPPSLLTSLGESLGLISRVDLDAADMDIIPGARYEYSIGLDHNTDLFMSLFHSETDIEFLKYDDQRDLVRVQRQRKIPLGIKIALSPDVAKLTSPFYSPDDKTIAWHIEAYNNRKVPAFPDPKISTWSNLPLLTNIPTFTIPPVVHVDLHTPESQRLSLYEKLWFYKWSRPLLTETIRRPKEGVAGSDWDQHEGRGGIYDFRGNWVSTREFCKPWESQVFGDRHGQWGEEADAHNDGELKVKGKGKSNGKNNHLKERVF